jgi:putative cardiolipin synthase
MAATDVTSVHSGYAKRRKALLRSGVHLYELKPDAPAGHVKKSGSSSASLHGKPLSVDRSRIWVGSFNLDQRSANLNTEMGVMIEDPRLAEALSNWVDRAPQDVAYEVILDPDAARVDRLTGQGNSIPQGPKVGFLKQLFVKILGWLPIEGCCNAAGAPVARRRSRCRLSARPRQTTATRDSATFSWRDSEPAVSPTAGSRSTRAAHTTW